MTCIYILYMYIHVHVLMRDEKEGRKKQTNNKAKQHSTPKAVTFPKKNELRHVYIHDDIHEESYHLLLPPSS